MSNEKSETTLLLQYNPGDFKNGLRIKFGPREDPKLASQLLVRWYACKEYLRAISMPCRYQIQILGPLLYVNRGFITIDKWFQNFNLTAGRPSLEKQPLKKYFVILFHVFS